MRQIPPEDLSGDAWSDYLEELREAWPADPELERKYGVAAGNGRFLIDMSENTTDDNGQIETDYEDDYLAAAQFATPEAVEFAPRAAAQFNKQMGRRAFLAGVGATAAAGMAGTAAGQEGTPEIPTGEVTPEFGSDFTPAPWIRATTTVAEHTPELLNDDGEGELMFDDNNGEPSDLTESGVVIADRDDEDSPHNPVSFVATDIISDELQDFPRGVTYDSDGDGEDDSDVRAVDATHWSVDEANTAGTMTVEDASDGGLHVTTSSQGSGDVAVATFNDFTIDSNEAKKFLQLFEDIDVLESGVVVTFRLTDSAGTTVTATIDPSADESTGSVIANQTATGDVYQRQLGEFTNGTDLDTIESLEIEVAEANADLTIMGLNLEREGAYEIGRQEFINSDDELDAETITEPRARTSYISLTGESDPDSETALLTTLPDARVYNVEYDTEIRTAELPSDAIDAEVVVPDRSDYDKEFHLVGGFDLGSLTENYDVSISPVGLYGKVRHPSSRYLTAQFAKGLSEIPTLDDTEDISWTDSTNTFENGDHRDGGDEVEMSASISGSAITGFWMEIQEDDSIIREMVKPAGGGGAPPQPEGGGFLSTIIGKVTAVGTGTVGALGLAKLLGGGE